MRLATRDLDVSIGGRRLVQALSIAFAPGQVWAVLGANGSGKTSLLHTLAGLRAPTRGDVTLDDRAVQAWPARARARHIALLLQDYEPDFPATVLDVALAGRHPYRPWFGAEETDARVRARAALADVGLAALEGRTMASLSGGERRRAEIAAILVQDTPVCLLDEPINHLDLPYQLAILDRFASRARTGALIVMALHDVNLALRFATHALLLNGDGGHRHGALDAVISAQTLATVYRCTFRALRDGEREYYVPT